MVIVGIGVKGASTARNHMEWMQARHELRLASAAIMCSCSAPILTQCIRNYALEIGMQTKKESRRKEWDLTNCFLAVVDVRRIQADHFSIVDDGLIEQTCLLRHDIWEC